MTSPSQDQQCLSSVASPETQTTPAARAAQGPPQAPACPQTAAAPSLAALVRAMAAPHRLLRAPRPVRRPLKLRLPRRHCCCQAPPVATPSAPVARAVAAAGACRAGRRICTGSRGHRLCGIWMSKRQHVRIRRHDTYTAVVTAAPDPPACHRPVPHRQQNYMYTHVCSLSPQHHPVSLRLRDFHSLPAAPPRRPLAPVAMNRPSGDTARL